MSMKQNGLGKLTEEAGEMLQIAGKLIQYPELQTLRNVAHPDGTMLHRRLEEEMGDTVAAINFVISKLNLSASAISLRAKAKLSLFKTWDSEPDTGLPVRAIEKDLLSPSKPCCNSLSPGLGNPCLKTLGHAGIHHSGVVGETWEDNDPDSNPMHRWGLGRGDDRK